MWNGDGSKCHDSFQRLRGCVVASQFTVAPKSSASSVVLSSVASKRFLRDSCTSAAFLSFFSRDGSAAFFGGEIWGFDLVECALNILQD